MTLSNWSRCWPKYNNLNEKKSRCRTALQVRGQICTFDFGVNCPFGTPSVLWLLQSCNLYQASEWLKCCFIKSVTITYEQCSKCFSTLRTKPLLFSFLCCSSNWKITFLFKLHWHFFSYRNIPQLMSESANVQFPKDVAENVFLWPLVADIHIRQIIQIGSLGFQHVFFGPVEGIIEYFILFSLRLLPCLTPHPRLYQNLIAIWYIFAPGFQVNFWF